LIIDKFEKSAWLADCVGFPADLADALPFLPELIPFLAVLGQFWAV
jgi:hypothetical protein